MNKDDISYYLQRVGEELASKKIIAGRQRNIGDARALAAYLGLKPSQDILNILGIYIPQQYLTAKIQYIVEDLFAEGEECG